MNTHHHATAHNIPSTGATRLSAGVVGSSSAVSATPSNTSTKSAQQPELALRTTTSNHSRSAQPPLNHSQSIPGSGRPQVTQTRSLSLSNTPVSRHFQPENFPSFLSKTTMDSDGRATNQTLSLGGMNGHGLERLSLSGTGRFSAMPITTLQDDRELALQEIKQIELEIHDALENGANDFRKRLLSDLARVERDRRLLDREIKNRIGFDSKKAETTDLDFLMSTLDISASLLNGARLSDSDLFAGDLVPPIPRARRTVSSSSAPVSPLLPSGIAGAFASGPGLQGPSSVRSVPRGFSSSGFGFEGIDDLIDSAPNGPLISDVAPLLTRSRSASSAIDGGGLSLDLPPLPTNGMSNGIHMLSNDVGLPSPVASASTSNHSASPSGHPQPTPRHGAPKMADAHTSPRIPHNPQRRVSMPVSHSNAFANSDAGSAGSSGSQHRGDSSRPSSTKSSSGAPSPSLPRANPTGHSTTHANISAHSMATYHGYKYKTLPCKFFRSGYCRNGDQCTYRHDHPRSCKNLFENRLCERGDNCNYSHDLQVAQNNLCYGFNSPDGCGWAACRFLHVSQHDIDNFPSRYAPPPALVTQLQHAGGNPAAGPPQAPRRGGPHSGGPTHLRHQALVGPPPPGLRPHGAAAMHLHHTMFHDHLHHVGGTGMLPSHMMGTLPPVVEHAEMPPPMGAHGQGPPMPMAVPAV